MLVAVVLALAVVAPAASEPAPAVRHYDARVVATYPHDSGAYTQGLVFADGTLLESTGRYGVSELRRVDLESGRVMRRVKLPDEHFGEGLALQPGGDGDPDRLVQLTWRAGVAAIRDAATFERLGEHLYSGEGWGLCWDAAGDRFVMSDGTSRLSLRDGDTFAETGDVTVRLDGRPVGELNELECVGGRVYANVYGTEQIVEVDPASGAVTAIVHAEGLLAADERRGTDVLNGIAHDPADGTYLVTGKLWPKLFRVELVEREDG